jgi:hypothetical protein
MRAFSLKVCRLLAASATLAFAMPGAVAAQAPSAQQKALDSLLQSLRATDWTGTSDPLRQLAVRYASRRGTFTASDSIHALARFIAAANSPDPFTRLEVPFLAERVPLPELLPVLRSLAEHDQSHLESEDTPDGPPFVHEASTHAVIALARAWLALPPKTRLAALEREVAASCISVRASLGAHCTAMQAALHRFGEHIRDSDSARAAIRDFEKSLSHAANAGLSELTALLLAQNDSLLEQSTFHLTVDPRMVSNVGDTITMTYTVHVISPKSDMLEQFFVDAPTLLHVNQPGGDRVWHVGDRIQGQAVASWANFAQSFAAGTSTPALPVTSRGLLGIVTFWGQRREPMSSMIYEPAFESGFNSDSIISIRGARGSTIGVVAFPQDMSPAGLAARLAALVSQSCELGWIDDRSVCSDLLARAKASAVALHELLRRLEALRGTHVSDPAQLLLTENARFLLTRL